MSDAAVSSATVSSEAATAAAAGPAPLPSWAAELKRRYLSGEATLFLLHGNVHDLVQSPDEPGKFVTLRDFLARFLSKSKEVVGFFNPSEGMKFAESKMQDSFLRTINAARMRAKKTELETVLPRDAHAVLGLLEEYLVQKNTRAAIVLDFIETVVAEATLAFMGPEDRANMVTLQRWASDPRMLTSDNLVILVTESLPDVNRRLVTNPQLASIKVTLPDEGERRGFLETLAVTYKQKDLPLETLAAISAGLSRIQIEGIFRQAWESQVPVTPELVQQRKKQIIERECYGLVEFMDSKHDFTKVGGMEHIKGTLQRIVQAIKKGQTRRVPMGILFVGPMGTGKTFLAEAFSTESGLTCLKLKNFRDKWVGSTEANLEKILGVVEAMGYVLVIIDEGDRSIGGNDGDGDGGTSSRVIARLKEFMSDTSHRGKIIFLMMTNRPDKLDADMKRSGRFDLKIPFFVPATLEERENIFRALLRKNKILHSIDSFALAVEKTDRYSGAEIEAVILNALGFAYDDGREEVTTADLNRAAHDFIPSRDLAMVDYMELLAVFEASSRQMLPARYQDLNTEELNMRLREMRRGLL